MSISPLTNLSTYIQAIGTAYIYIGTFTSGGLDPLGPTEGEISVDESFQYNDYTLPEWTGEALHNRDVDGASLAITAPMILGDTTLYDKLNPLGQAGSGYSRPQPVVTTSVLIVPRNQVPDAGLSLTAGVWAPAAPDHCVFIWKATVEPARYAYRHQEGGKVIREVTFRPMFDDTMPEGYKLYTIGDPIAQGITGIEI